MKTLVILENDNSLERLPTAMKRFIREYDGEVIELTGLKFREQDEIVGAVSKCTDILCYSMLINGSEVQLVKMARMLMMFKDSKNLYLRFSDGVRASLKRELKIETLVGLEHHNIFEVEYDELTPVNFNEEIAEYREEQRKIKEYKDLAVNRVIGKVKIVGYNANGSLFQDLPIGEVVDTYDMSEQDPSPHMGVWVMGNGEPVKLVNYPEFTEYEPVEFDEDLLGQLLRAVGVVPETLNELELLGMQTYILEGDDSNQSKAQYICDTFDIPRRHNRALLRDLLDKNLVVSE